MTLLVLRRAGQVFSRMPSYQNFSHNETEVMGFGKDDHRGKVPFSSHCIKGTYHQHDL